MGISAEVALAAANSYTAETVIGGGAVIGKNCTISSIADINGGHRVNFAWTLDDGTDKSASMDVMNGSVIVRYSTMPEIADLFAMDNKTVFETEGFYAQNDGNGGTYLITTSAKRGGRAITYNGNTRYLLILDDYGKPADEINVCKYGIRPYEGNLVTDEITKENTFATQNTNIITNIYLMTQQGTFKFPKGRFVFADPLDLKSRNITYKGSCVPANSKHEIFVNASDSSIGTVLCFPFLENGQKAISTNSDLSDLIVYGNLNTYNISFDRTKTISAPEEVVTETIAQSSGTDIKCTGIYCKAGVLENVSVCGFHVGIDRVSPSNGYLFNIFCCNCHYGIKFAGDNKAVGIYGWNVHTLIYVYGHSLHSIMQARVDNCVHMVELRGCNAVTLHDFDGDYCTDSLILVEGDAKEIIATALHGRCNTLKSYDGSGGADPIDVRNLDNTAGYGIIRVGNSRHLKNCHFSFNRSGGQNPFDNSSDYKTPETVLTMDNWASFEDCTFELPITATSSDYILSLFQTNASSKARIDTSSGTFYIKGESANDLKSITAASSDFADFQSKIAAL